MVSSLFYHKQGFHVARAETPPRERDLASDLGIAKMHHRQKFVVHPSLSLIGLDHDMTLMSVVKPQGDSESQILFFIFSNGWSHWCALRFYLVAPLRN